MILKQKISAAFIGLSMPYLIMTACDSAEQKAQNAKWEEQASYNALAYIQHKYGFAAEITEAKVDRESGMFGGRPLSEVLVQMTHDSRDFTVYITGAEASDAGADSYQAAEIKQVLFDQINTEVGGLRVLDLQPRPKSARDTDEPLYSTYFDGSNLPALMQESIAGFRAYYLQTDFSDAQDFAALETLLVSCVVQGNFVSCRNEDVFAMSVPQRKWCTSHAVYCAQSRSLAYKNANGETVAADYQVYDLQKFGEFYYSVSVDSDADSDAVPHFEEVPPPDPAIFDGWGALNATIASKAYTVSADADMVIHIYYPDSAIDNFASDDRSRDDIDCGSIYKGQDGEENHRAHPVKAVGDYVYEEIGLAAGKQHTFVFLCDP